MAATTGFVYDGVFLRHDTGPGHPERPDRLSSIVRHLHAAGLWPQLQHLPVTPAEEDRLLAVHTPEHIRFVREACRNGARLLDAGDTRVCPVSYDIALLAVGGVLGAVDAVLDGRIANAFCAVRPPGHHAGSGTAMGFCLFNTVAAAARHAQARHGVGRVAIIDWDVHHGNGTQEIFYDDPSVLYVSLHQYPFYPGTGARDERGDGPGAGATLNIPMTAGSGEEAYAAAFTGDILPALERFRPELLLISAGFDAHRDDPLANIMLTDASFARLTDFVRDAAAASCGGRIVSVLEGGYNVLALARSVEAHLRRLCA